MSDGHAEIASPELQPQITPLVEWFSDELHGPFPPLSEDVFGLQDKGEIRDFLVRELHLDDETNPFVSYFPDVGLPPVQMPAHEVMNVRIGTVYEAIGIGEDPLIPYERRAGNAVGALFRDIVLSADHLGSARDHLMTPEAFGVGETGELHLSELPVLSRVVQGDDRGCVLFAGQTEKGVPYIALEVPVNPDEPLSYAYVFVTDGAEVSRIMQSISASKPLSEYVYMAGEKEKEYAAFAKLRTTIDDKRTREYFLYEERVEEMNRQVLEKAFDLLMEKAGQNNDHHVFVTHIPSGSGNTQHMDIYARGNRLEVSWLTNPHEDPTEQAAVWVEKDAEGRLRYRPKGFAPTHPQDPDIITVRSFFDDMRVVFLSDWSRVASRGPMVSRQLVQSLTETTTLMHFFDRLTGLFQDRQRLNSEKPWVFPIRPPGQYFVDQAPTLYHEGVTDDNTPPDTFSPGRGKQN